MKERKIGKYDVSFYESISEMPIKRFHIYNKYLIINSGIGSDEDSLMTHFAKLNGYIEKNDKDNATIELQNLMQNISFMLGKTHPITMTLAALIYSIDGVVIDDISESGLAKIVEKLNTIKISFLKKIVNDIKKKTTESWKRICRILSIMVRQKNISS